MKLIIVSIMVFFFSVMAVVWIASERAAPVFLPQPANFLEPLGK